MRSKKLTGFIIPILVGVFNILIILFPADIIAAAREGLVLWFNNVLPSLLPFIIFTNILTECGALEFIGMLLEPVMRPLFGVPGVGGFALAAGMTSGYPMGAKVVAQLRSDDLISRTEAQRLISFCNNSGPLFMLGAVGVSMLQSAKLGYFIMAVHYISAIVTGLIFRYYGVHDEPSHKPKPTRTVLRREPNLGKILGDSVKNAMETIALVGGFIILFSVIVRILEITQFSRIVEVLLAEYSGLSPQTCKGLVIGALEITNGAKALASDSFSKTQIAAVCGIISFGGFCIHAQAINFIAHTDIKASLYILAKSVQALISFATAALLFPFAVLTGESAAPAFLSYESRFFDKLAFSTISFTVLILAVLVLSAGYGLTRRR